MDRNESDPSKLKEIPTFPDTEIDSAQATCSEGDDSSPSKAISKETVQKAIEEILPRVASMQSPSENTKTDSEYATCSEGVATSSDNVPENSASSFLTKDSVEKQWEEMFSKISSLQLLSEMNEESETPRPLYSPIPCRATSGGKPKSSKSIKKFLRSRIKQLKSLSDFIHKVNIFMTDVAVNILDAERHDPNVDVSTCISEDFSEIYQKWEIVREFLLDAMAKTKKMLDPDHNELTLTDIEKYIDCISLLEINLHDLAVICYNGLDKYRSICKRFEDYHFLVHINVLPRQVRDVLEQSTFVLDSFGTYYNDSESEDSE